MLLAKVVVQVYEGSLFLYWVLQRRLNLLYFIYLARNFIFNPDSRLQSAIYTLESITPAWEMEEKR